MKKLISTVPNCWNSLKFSGLRPNKCYFWSRNPVFLFYMKFYMKYFHVEFHVEFFKTVHVEFYMSHVEKNYVSDDVSD